LARKFRPDFVNFETAANSILRALNDSGLRLTKTGRGLIAAPMINAATILIARRRRTVAVWADICV